jgi:hypothetical protein
MRIQQILDEGTTNPIVARLSIQTQNLLPFYNLSEDQRQKIFGIMFADVQPKSQQHSLAGDRQMIARVT